MRLTHLSLSNFRLFSRLDVDLPAGILLLVGNNAQGKTSILESMYLLATFTSFHASSDRQLVNFQSVDEDLAVGRVVAEYLRGERSHRLEVRLILEKNGNGGKRFRKEILLDGTRVAPAQVVGHFASVIFLPQMTRVIEGGPDERRRYLNLTISQSDAVYTRALTEYHQALTQRNALLKLLAERGGDPVQLSYWNEILTSRGAILLHARIHAISEIGAIAARIHRRLTQESELLQLAFQPSINPGENAGETTPQPSLALGDIPDFSGLDRETIQANFLSQLERSRREELARGVTVIGPHRDELRMLVNGVDLGNYGSRGQIRTALLAVKMAEVEWLKSKIGFWPVLLLDETLAELDLQRRADLLAFLDGYKQAILTTTDIHLFPPDFAGKGTLWHVQDGSIIPA